MPDIIPGEENRVILVKEMNGLHKEKNKKETLLEVLEPGYMEQFVCTGSLCPDTCCQGWEIVIDPATCERYEKSSDAELKGLLARAIEHHMEMGPEGPEDVAAIRQGQGGRCLFLRNDGLCMIQRHTEETNLSETCRTYPRVLYCWNDAYAERALCVSCPEAARLILGGDAPLQFVTKRIPTAELDGLRITDAGEHLLESCVPLRRELIQILQDRLLPLRERLQLADDCFWKMGGLDGHRLRRRLQGALQQEEQRRLSLEQLPPSALPGTAALRTQLLLLQQVVSLRLQNPALRPDFQAALQRAVRRWQLGGQEPVGEEAVQCFRADRSQYEDVFLPAYGPLLENYLVNGVFKNIFITDGPAPFYREWFRLLLQFSLARLLLIAAAADAALPPRGDVIELLRITARAVGHDAAYLQQAEELLGSEAEVRGFCAAMMSAPEVVF